MTRTPRHSGSTALLLLAFFLSGYAALSYEMAWVRLLVMSLGVTYFAITTILTAFMTGLATGALVAGRLVDRWRVHPLLVFAGLELFLAVYAQLFHGLTTLVDTAYIGLTSQAELSFTTHSLLRMAFAIVVLFPPTLVSGATLPVAVKAFITRDDGIGQGVAALYGANVLGATLGCFATIFFVIGLLGYPATAWIGTTANLTAAILTLWVYRRGTASITAVAPTAPAPKIWLPGALAVGSAFFAVGFASMGNELLWTRVLSQFGFNPATSVFGLVLTTYLIGHAVGALWLYPTAIRRLAAPRLFVLLVASFAALVAFSVLSLSFRFDGYTAIGPLRHIGLVLPWERTWVLIPGVFLPAACTGALLPLASRLGIRGTAGLGSGVGSLAALSTVGGILGSFTVGFWLMPALGAIPCLVLMAAWCALAALWSRWALADPPIPVRSTAFLTSGIAAVAAVLVVTVPPYLHLILFPGEQILAFAEGRNASSAVVDAGLPNPLLLVSGERVSGGGSDIPLAMAIHPSARTAAVIGLGTGTVTADALRDERLERVIAVDIDGDLPDMLPLIQGQHSALFLSPRFEFVENDGRHHLKTSQERFDLIVNDAAIYAWYLELSTLEFNRLAASRLSPEGIYVGRLHLYRITEHAFRAEVRTFIEVFPNAAFWRISADIGMLVGRNGDLPVDAAQNGEALPQGRELWYDADQLRAMVGDAKIITDQHPLHIPRIFRTEDLQPIIEYTSLADLPSPGSAAPQGFPSDPLFPDQQPMNPPPELHPAESLSPPQP